MGLRVTTSCSSNDDNSSTTETIKGTTTGTATQTVSTTTLSDATSYVLNSHTFGSTVTIALNGTSATVTNNVLGVSVTNNSGIVNITSTASGVNYVLSGNNTGSVNFVSNSVAKVTLNVTSSAYNGIYTLAGIVANETTFNITSAVDGIKTIDNPITLNGEHTPSSRLPAAYALSHQLQLTPLRLLHKTL